MSERYRVLERNKGSKVRREGQKESQDARRVCRTIGQKFDARLSVLGDDAISWSASNQPRRLSIYSLSLSNFSFSLFPLTHPSLLLKLFFYLLLSRFSFTLPTLHFSLIYQNLSLSLYFGILVVYHVSFAFISLNLDSIISHSFINRLFLVHFQRV